MKYSDFRASKHVHVSESLLANVHFLILPGVAKITEHFVFLISVKMFVSEMLKSKVNLKD